MVILFLYTPTVKSIKYQAESSFVVWYQAESSFVVWYQAESSFVVWKRGHGFKFQMELKSLNSTFIYIKQ
jgi:hypothetical protein